MIRVLVVDDHPAVRSSLAAFIDAADGLQVVGEAADGQQAIDMAERLLPQVVLMDVRMPVLDGIEATRRLKAVSGGPEVVLISAYEQDELEHAGRDAGAAAFVMKGVRGAELAAHVRSAAR